MRSVQSLDILKDTHIVVSDFNVRSSAGAPIAPATTSIVVNLFFTDVTSGNSDGGATDIMMARLSLTGSWRMLVSDIIAKLGAGFFKDKHKYVGMISGATIQDMRIEEFVVDLHDLELTISELPYELEFGVGIARKKWYADEVDFGNNSKVVLWRNLYSGNIGNTPASRHDNVTHEGKLNRGAL